MKCGCLIYPRNNKVAGKGRTEGVGRGMVEQSEVGVCGESCVVGHGKSQRF